eukprot:497603-Rhodomonas_salina.1
MGTTLRCQRRRLLQLELRALIIALYASLRGGSQAGGPQLWCSTTGTLSEGGRLRRLQGRQRLRGRSS